MSQDWPIIAKMAILLYMARMSLMEKRFPGDAKTAVIGVFPGFPMPGMS